MESNEWLMLYPWNPRKEEYFQAKTPKQISSNIHIKECEFERIAGDYVVKCDGVSNVYILVESSIFKECEVGEDRKEVVYLSVAGSSCCSFLKTSFLSCKSNTDDSSFENQFIILNIQTPNTQYCSTKLMMTSFCQCGLNGESTLRSLLFVSDGRQSYQEMNVSKCKSGEYCLLQDHTSNGIASYNNMIENQAKRSILYMNYRGVVRNCNFISNIQTTEFDYFGIVTTTNNESVLIVENSFFKSNNCLSLSYITNGELILMHCSIDEAKNVSGAEINTRVSFGSITLPGVATKAKKCLKIGNINITSLSLICLLGSIVERDERENRSIITCFVYFFSIKSRS